MSDLLLDYSGLARYDSKIKQYINSSLSSINQDIVQINQSLAGKTVTSSIAVTIDVSDWDEDNSATVTALGVSSVNDVIVVPDPSSASLYANSQILCISQGTNSLTFECAEIPDSAVIVNVLIIN